MDALIRRRALTLGLLGTAFGLRSQAQATAPAPPAAASADELKAAYLHKFAGYVEWPPQALPAPGAPFVVGVAMAARVQAELQRIVPGRPVLGRPVLPRPMEARPSPDADHLPLHVLFVSHELGAGAAPMLAIYRHRPVLTVTDLPGGIEHGAILGFVEVERRVRFEASLANAQAAGLRLSSRLLTLAERVTGATP